MLPNYTSVEGTTEVKPITSGESFKMAALDSFDPMVYPLFGFIAGVAQLQNQPASWGSGWSGYAKRYGAAFTDNTVCSLVTTGLCQASSSRTRGITRATRQAFSTALPTPPVAAQ